MSIKKFAILGERCSGTNFLEESIKNNFNINYTTEYGNKHFFCFNNYPNNEDTLFIGIVRNPIYWLNSFSKELHHVPKINKNIQNFFLNEFYSVLDDQDTKRSMFDFNIFSKPEILNTKDLNYLNGNKYKDIFELRIMKNNYLMNIMPYKVKNYILINYESLLYNYDETLNKIQQNFNIVKKNEAYVKIKKYKKSDSYNFQQQRIITLNNKLINYIWQNLNAEQETALGYVKDDDNTKFKNSDQNII